MDDDAPTIEIASRVLRARGHSVASAGSAEAGAAALAAAAFDLVLLDVVLPGKTGLQALAEFRALTRAPIHVMSGNSDEDARRDALLLGASGFLGKPLDLSAVAALADALPPRAG